MLMPASRCVDARRRRRVHARAGLLVLPVAMLLHGCGERPTTEAQPRYVRTLRIGGPADTLGHSVPAFPAVVLPRTESLLAFQVPGRIITRLVDVGTQVPSGAELAQLDPTDLALAAEGARAGLRAAEADATTAATELVRTRELHAQQLLPDAALERAIAAAASTAARRDDARARAEAAESATRHATLVAPSGGVITAVQAEVGQVVGAGQPVLTLARSGALDVAIDVPESTRRTLRLGQVAQVTWERASSEPSAPAHRATIREISPSPDVVTGAYRVRLALAPTDSTPPTLGQSAVVRLASVAAPGERSIPSSALVQTRSTPGVWVLGPNRDRALFRPVEVARVGDGQVTIRRGLSVGDEIVTGGANRLDTGLVITPWDGRLP
jgi:multidrug efflux system membrane fusion protein